MLWNDRKDPKSTHKQDKYNLGSFNSAISMNTISNFFSHNSEYYFSTFTSKDIELV